MGNRYLNHRIEQAFHWPQWRWGLSPRRHHFFTHLWANAHVGRYYKRRHSKAARRWQDTHQRGLSKAASECKYKRW